MKVEGIKNVKTILVSMTADELAKITKFGDSYSLRQKMDNCFNYSEFSLEILGKEFDVTEIYNEAKQALDLHKEALTSAEALKKASSRFLGFFAEK